MVYFSKRLPVTSKHTTLAVLGGCSFAHLLDLRIQTFPRIWRDPCKCTGTNLLAYRAPLADSEYHADVRELIHPVKQPSGLLSNSLASSISVSQQARNGLETSQSQISNQPGSPRNYGGNQLPDCCFKHRLMATESMDIVTEHIFTQAY